MISPHLEEQLSLLPDYLGNHLLLTLVAMIVGIVVCIPLGIMITRIKSLQWPVLTIAGILQTIPGIALLALMVSLIGKIGFIPALIALIIYSFLPILRNTVTGILGVDKSIVEAAVGMGMTDFQRLYKVELPLALPVLVAGVRTAAVWVVGTATLATPVGATSLGNYIFSGLQTQNLTAIVVGCIAAASLAIILDQLIHLGELATARRNKKMGLFALTGLFILLGGGLAPIAIESFDDDNSAVIVIGSKPFTEQYILAGLIDHRLTESGIKTDLRSGMGSTILFEALSDNAIDCYIDYSGTIWTNIMKREDMPDKNLMLNEITEWLQSEYGITCLGRLGFENTYALVVKKEFAEKRGLESIEDLALYNSELSMGSDYEFFLRAEWKALKEKYNLNFDDLITLDPTLMYQAIADDEVDIISAYSTDGRIVDYNLVVLKDPKQALPPYDAVILVSPEASKNNKLILQLNQLIGQINDKIMRNANKQVDVDGLAVDNAVMYLKDLLDKNKNKD